MQRIQKGLAIFPFSRPTENRDVSALVPNYLLPAHSIACAGQIGNALAMDTCEKCSGRGYIEVDGRYAMCPACCPHPFHLMRRSGDTVTCERCNGDVPLEVYEALAEGNS